MKVTRATRRALGIRREERYLKRLGYRKHETDWEVHRGHRIGDIILDTKISMDGRYVYTLVGPANGATGNGPSKALGLR